MTLEFGRPLRFCRKCGLEAHTEKDLELFRISKISRYGRMLICKSCYNALRGPRSASKEQRKRAEFCEIFRARSPDGILRCYFCGEAVTKLEGSNSDSLNIHSLDENHENWTPANKVPTHHSCHLSYHKTGKKNTHLLVEDDYFETLNRLKEMAERRHRVLPMGKTV